MTKTIVLMGTASHWVETPFTSPDHEIWGTGTTALEVWENPTPESDIVPRFDAWFDIHSPGGMADNLIRNPHYAKFLTTDHGKPIYTNGIGPEGGIPNATQYPRDEMFDKYGEQFFRSSFDWMGYMALEETLKRGGKTIEAYGFDMAAEGEYADQRPSAQHFIWVCEEMHGIEVVTPPTCKLRNHPRAYGTGPDPLQADIQHRVSVLAERLREKRALHARTAQEINYLEGSIFSLSEHCIANFGVKPKQ